MTPEPNGVTKIVQNIGEIRKKKTHLGCIAKENLRLESRDTRLSPGALLRRSLTLQQIANNIRCWSCVEGKSRRRIRRHRNASSAQ
jgi:hypothetical protein